MRSGAERLMNLPPVSLCFNTKSQEWAVTHRGPSVSCNAAANLRPAMTSAILFHCAQGRTKAGQPTPEIGFIGLLTFISFHL